MANVPSPYVYNAEVISVYDGDTCTVILDLGLNVRVKTKIRLHGIDTPEIRGGTKATKKAAITARDYVREEILGKVVRVHSVKKGKYGRLVSIVWQLDADGSPVSESINDALVRLGMAVRKSY